MALPATYGVTMLTHENASSLPVINGRAHGMPAAQGLYTPANEHDSCGVGFVAHIKGKKSNEIVKNALKMLCNLEHRGAVGADPHAGDGAGILVQIPHSFFAKSAKSLGFSLPEAGHYGVGHIFMPHDDAVEAKIKTEIEAVAIERGHKVLGWRKVPTSAEGLGETVKTTEPRHWQVFIGRGAAAADEADFERALYFMRKMLTNAVYNWQNEASKGFYVVSLSCRTIVYKGMFLSGQLGQYYADLRDESFESAIGLVHQRFSTNTFPAWSLAHPYRMVAHNGEINTLRGNVNWMAARQSNCASELFGDDIEKLWPISWEGQSDTACFDNALEFLVQGGYSLPHAVMMMIPEAWAGNPLMSDEQRAFYEYHAALMEPWDGPAAVAFTNGIQIGATLDRNGLRPARYLVTDDDMVILASEMGALEVPEEKIVKKWRLQPGKMLLIDTQQGRIVSDEELKDTLAAINPYQKWLDNTQMVLEDLPEMAGTSWKTPTSLLDRQQAFGYSQEDIKLIMAPMAATGQEAIGSMGNDSPIAAMSDRSKLLYNYFKQKFAQVTNPPIDPIREEHVMSLVSFIGPRPNLFDLKGYSKQKRLEVRQPILTNIDLEKIQGISAIAENYFLTITLDLTYPIERGAENMRAALARVCQKAEDAVRAGHNIIVLSDRLVGEARVAIPALLATSGVHNHLIRKGLRTSVGLVVETGEAREVHHFACLAGFGAEAINPYLAFETVLSMKKDMPANISEQELVYRYIKAIDKGLLKVMSKMGISTYQSYCGAQIFDAIGLGQSFVDEFFFGTATSIEGVGLDEVAIETFERHKRAFGNIPELEGALDVGGEYGLRMRGEQHVWAPDSVANLQHAVRANLPEKYRAFAAQVNEEDAKRATIRGLFKIKSAADFGRKPIPLDEVEPASEIVKRFATGAMSFGSISREAHTTLAKAMNAIGGKSNTGEGGEEPERLYPLPGQPNMRSAIKQVASGRFGVTTEYLVCADQIQIKVAQGAKPGEGGQLPGHKVNAVIARVRFSTQGVGLISPPPHHDIYSIEDLAQLIFDLKNVNPKADISVKLVSSVGVGTVAAGVAKARADHIVIAGYEGGTGASPLTAIKHAGLPWEIGLAETQQTLVMNKLRSRVAVQVDGGLRTGRDVVVGALLGADEYGFATAPLIAAGCIMMRKCHLNTCPVGVATQDPELRRRFKGTPEHVINYFFFVAEEVRELLAQMGVKSLREIIGATEFLDQDKSKLAAKSHGLDVTKLFYKPEVKSADELRHSAVQEHPISNVLDVKMIAQAQAALETGKKVKIALPIHNVDRSTGAMISGQVAMRYGHKGLPDGTIDVTLTGTAGQAFGAWVAKGVSLTLVGEGNDYIGKGLSGGRLIIKPHAHTRIVPHQSIIAGNTALYGAIAGECYIAGVAGERFAVRNSGAIAVVEGTGDNACEYMTGGLVLILGQTGRNFAAGMSGGVAYVLDEAGDFAQRCNMAMVDLEPVLAEAELLKGEVEFKGKVDVQGHIGSDDEKQVKALITAHVKRTGSARGQDILHNWAEYRGKFVKVMPIEYARALREGLAIPVAAE